MARRDDDGESRPKRSWREIDKMRDSSRSRSSRGDRPGGEARVQRSQAYQQYKSNLDKFFSGSGPTPAGGLQELLDPTGEKSERTRALQEIAKASAEDRKRWADLTREFVAAHPLPDDPFFLTDLLGHPRESVAAKGLEKLAALAGEGRIKKVPASLEQHLRSLELTADEDEIRAAAKALREKLRG